MRRKQKGQTLRPENACGLGGQLSGVGGSRGASDMALPLRNMGLKINVGVSLVGKGLKERGKEGG